MSWMRTGDAAHHLGISTDTLKRKMESKGGFLKNKVHFNLGPSKNSAILWDVDRIRAAFNQRGLQARSQQGVS